jgi:hypothetical protein
MTLLGAIFLPIALVCFLWRPAYLLPLLVIASIIEIGFVFNGAIGTYEFGVPPFFMVAVLIAIRLVIAVWDKGRLLPASADPLRGVAVALLAFWAWSCVSAFVMPHLFAGIPVYDPREGLNIDFIELGEQRFLQAIALQGPLGSGGSIRMLAAATACRPLRGFG